MSRFDGVDSVNIPSLGDLPLKEGSTTFKPSGVSRDHIAGERASDGGYTEKNTPAELTLTLNASPFIDVETMNSIKNENITITLAEGKSYLMSAAWSAEASELTKGEISCKFISNKSEQL